VLAIKHIDEDDIAYLEHLNKKLKGLRRIKVLLDSLILIADFIYIL